VLVFWVNPSYPFSFFGRRWWWWWLSPWSWWWFAERNGVRWRRL
jgi:hypothetical protein